MFKNTLLYLILLLVTTSSIQAQTCLPNWDYRVPITITASTSLSDFQIVLTDVDLQTLVTNSKLQSDWDDLRFYDDMGTELAYWVEESDRIWIKVPTLTNGSNTIYMFYGNSTATATTLASGDSTFELFDDFEGSTLDTDKWNTCQTGTAPSVSSGAVTFDINAAEQQGIVSKNVLASTSIRAEMKVLNTSSPRNRTYLGLVNESANNGYAMLYKSVPSADSIFSRALSLTTDCPTFTALTGLNDTVRAVTDIEGNWEFIWSNTGAQSFLWPDDSVSLTDAAVAPNNIKIALGVAETASTTEVDWLFARQYTAITPTAVSGTEDLVNAPVNLMANATTLCEDTDLTLTVAAVSGATYNWDGPHASLPMNGSMDNSIALNIDGTDGGDYSVSITLNGCTTDRDSLAITVSPITVAGNLLGEATVCRADNSGTITLSGNIGDVVKWQRSNNNGTTYININTPDSSIFYTNLTQTALYRAIVQSGDCDADTTTPATITVSQPTVAGNLSGEATVCRADNSGTITLSSNIGDVVKWQRSNNNGSTYININTTDPSIPYTNLTQTTLYRAIVQSGACNPDTTTLATITVSQPTVAGNLSGGTTVCSGDNSGTISLSGNIGDVVKWQRSNNNGSTYFNINTSATSIPYANLTQLTLYRAIVKSGACDPDTTMPATITISPATVVGILSGDATVCTAINSGTITLSGHTGDVVRWIQSTNNGNTYTNINTSNTSITYTNLTQTTLYRAVVKSGACDADTTVSTIITVAPTTVAGTLSGATTVPPGINTGTITLSGHVGTVVKWENSIDNGNTYTDIVNTSTTLTYNNLSQTTLYRAVVKSGTCDSETTMPLTITVSPPTVAGTISGAGTVCSGVNNGTLTLSGNIGNVLKWERSTNNGNSYVSIVNMTTSNTFTNLTQTTLYRVIIQSGASNPDTTAPVTVTVSPVTVSGTVTGAQTVCNGVNNGTLNLSGNVGNILRWEASTNGGSTYTLISNTTSSLSFRNLTQTTLYRAVVQSGACSEEATIPVEVTVSPTTVAGTLSGTQTVCSGTNTGIITLSGNSGGVVRWEFSINGGNTYAPIAHTSSSYTFSNLTQTTHYRAVVQSGACQEENTLPVVITASSASLAGTLSGVQTVCSGINNGSLTLSGQIGNVVRWEFSTNSGATYSPIANTTTSYSFTNLNQTTQYRAVVQNGLCPAVMTSPLIITVSPTSVAGTLAGAQTVCSGVNSGSITLSGNTGNVVRWEASTDNGNNYFIISNTSTTQSFSNLTQSTLYRAVIQSGACPEVMTTAIEVTVSPNSVAGTLAGAQTVCNGTNTGILTLSGQAGNILRWESSTDNGNTFSTINNTTDTYTFNNLSQTTLYRAVVNSGVCPDANSTTAEVTVSPTTVAGSLSGAQTVCNGSNNGTLSLSGNVGSVIEWEASTDGGNTYTSINNTTTSLDFNNLTQTTYYQAVVKSGVCPTETTMPVIVTVSSNSLAGTLSGAQTVCSGTNGGTLSLSGNLGAILRWEASTDNGSTFTTINNTTATYNFSNLSQTTLYQAVVNNGACPEANTAPVEVTVSPNSVAGTLSGAQTVCSGNNNGTLVLNGNVGNVIRWEASTDNGSTYSPINSTTTTYSFNDLTVTTQYRAVVKSEVCPEETSMPITVTVSLNTVAGTLTGEQTVCSGTNSGTLSLTGNVGDVIRWEASTNGGTTYMTINTTTTNYIFDDLTATTQYRAVVKSGVCPEVATTAVTVTVSPNSVAGTLSGAQTVCSGTNGGTISLSGKVGDIVGWEFSTDDGNSYTSLNHTTATYSFNDLTTTTDYRVLVKSGVCPEITTIPLRISVSPNTVAGMLSPSIDSVCISNNTVQSITLNSQIGNVLTWQESPSAAPNSWVDIPNTSNQNAFPYSGTGIGSAGNIYYRAIVASGVCPADVTDDTRITVSSNTIVGSLPDTISVCKADETDYTIQLSGNLGRILRWENLNRTTNNWQPTTNSNTDSSSFTYRGSQLPTGITQYRVVVQSGACASGNTNALSIDTRNTPNTDFTIPSAECQGVTIDFNVPINDNDISYNWNFDIGSGSSELSTLHTYNTPGVKSVTLIAAINNVGCSDTTTKEITINATPRADLTLISNVCQGSPVIFNNDSDIDFPGVITEYIWDFGVLGSATQVADQNPKSFTYNVLNSYDISLTATTDEGCTNKVDTTITVLPRPDVTFQVDDACEDIGVAFTNQTTVSNNEMMTYEWLIDGRTLTETSPTYAYTIPGTKLVRLTATTVDGGCSEDATRALDIYPRPTTGFTTEDVCFGTSATFINNSTLLDQNGNPTGTMNYEWNMGENTIFNTENVTHDYASPNTYTVILTTTSDQACVATDTQDITINYLPTANFDANPVCLDDAVRFRNISDILRGTISATWDMNDGTTLNDFEPVYTYTTDGNYNVRLIITSDANCADTTIQNVIVYPLPEPSLSVDSVCETEASEFNNTSSINSGEIIEYQWRFGDGANSFEENPNHTYATYGSYTTRLTLLSDKGCRSAISQNVVVHPKPISDFDADNVCFNEEMDFSNLSTIPTGRIDAYDWGFGDGATSTEISPSHTYTEANRYTVSLLSTSDFGCQHTITNAVEVYALPNIQITQDTTLSKGYSVQLLATGGEDYAWLPQLNLDDPSIADPIATPLNPITYMVTVTDSNNCQNMAQTSIGIVEDFQLFVSNVITPDGNGQNDTWIVENIGTYNASQVVVVDIWGKEVLNTRAYQNDWGATDLPDGTYYYFIKFDNSNKVYKGAITVLRN